MSHRHLFLYTTAALAAGAFPLHAQTLRLVPSGTQPGATGRAVTELDDWSNPTDGVAEYAVADFVNTAGGPLAGQVIVYDGASGAVLRTINGTGVSSCGAAGPTGDQLGFDLTTISDIDSDGRRELLATRPGARGTVGGCSPGHGGFMIIHSNPATANFVYTAPQGTSLGDAAAGLDPDAGVPTFVVGTGNSVQVFQGTPPALVTTISTFALQGSALTSAGTNSTNGKPAFAANASGGQVFVRDITGSNMQTISSGLGGTSFGSRLATLNDAGQPPAIVIGAPAASGFDGLVEVWPVGSGSFSAQIQGFPSSAEGLGAAVASGGDVDGDGDGDFVTLASNGTRTRIFDRNGTQANHFILHEANVTAQALAIVPDMQTDGFDEVLVGGDDLGGPNRSWIYHGGPDASVTVVGSPCSQGTPFLPVIAINGLPVVGSSPVIGQSGGSPNSLSVLFGGVIDPVGSPLGGCLVHLLASPAPVGGFTTVTDAAGAWVSPPISLPSPSLLGAQAAFQAVTFTSGGPWEFSNALNLRVGW